MRRVASAVRERKGIQGTGVERDRERVSWSDRRVSETVGMMPEETVGMMSVVVGLAMVEDKWWGESDIGGLGGDGSDVEDAEDKYLNRRSAPWRWAVVRSARAW